LRVLGEFDSGGLLILGFCFGFKIFLVFSWFCRFLCLLLAFAVFLFLNDLLELFVGFWSSSCASWSLGLELQSLYILLSMDSSRRRLRNQVVSFLV
jgi:hypothetical protein